MGAHAPERNTAWTRIQGQRGYDVFEGEVGEPLLQLGRPPEGTGADHAEETDGPVNTSHNASLFRELQQTPLPKGTLTISW